MSQAEILQSIKTIIREHLGCAYKLFLFGSRVGDSTEARSDYDIGIEGPAEVSLSILARVQAEVRDLPIFQSVDIVDFKSVDKPFYDIAIKKRQWIN